MAADFLARILPRRIRQALRVPMDGAGRWWYRSQLEASGFKLAQGGPALSYGAAIPRQAGALVNGGRVKLTHLDRAFPENPAHFNLLYLVSSAIPPHAMELVSFARRRGAKMVWNQNGVAYPAWAGKFVPDINEPMRALLFEADFVVYQSEFCRASADHFLGAARCPAAILYNPVDVSAFCPAELLPPVSELRLLTMGTHTYRERVLVTLECLAALRRTGRDAMLTIAGRLQWQNAADDVKRAIGDLALRDSVTLRPAFSQAEAAGLCRAHHVLLHPKYMDPCPTVVIEALACGLPVVGAKSGGMPELVAMDCGRLIPVKDDWEAMHTPDAAAMAAAVGEIAADWASFSTAARRRAVERFDARAWVERHRAIFADVLHASA